MSASLSEDAQRQLDGWPPRARTLLHELLEDAGSALQRELIVRAVAAAHTASEVHAFADELRGMSDEEAYAACTLHDDAPADYTVAQLLRAESDPLFAFELQGGAIEPNEALELSPPPPPESAISAPQLDPVSALLKGRRPVFEAESQPPRDWSGPPSAPQAMAPQLGPAAGDRRLEAAVNEATRSLGLGWREHALDVPGGLTLVEALASAQVALTRGLPLVAGVGPRAGEHRRLVVLLQCNVSAKTRAWQLYDPLSRELVWANEGDLLTGRELPFANKANRRLTRVVLPRNLEG